MTELIKVSSTKEGKKALQEMTDIGLDKLKERYLTVPDVATKDGYDLVVSGARELRDIRVSVEKKRKELKAGALEWGRLVDSEAKRITGELLQLENPIKEAKKVIDNEKARIKEEKRIADEKRKNEILARIDEIRILVSAYVGKTSEAIDSIRQETVNLDLSEGFDEFTETAERVKDSTIAGLDSLYERTKDQEEAAKRQAEEETRLAAEREKFRLEQEEQEKKRIAEQAKKDEADKIAREKQEQERLAEQEKRDAADKIAREKREAEEKELARKKAEIYKREAELKKKEDAEKEAAAKKAAEEKLEAEKEAEKKRLAAEKKADLKAASIRRAATIQGLIDTGCVLPADADKLLDNIVGGHIPNLTYQG